MYFVTNRVFHEGLKTTAGRKVTFDLNNSTPTNSVFFCQRMKKNDYREVGSLDFFAKLQHIPCPQILFYVHGFNQLPEADIFQRATLLQSLLDGLEQNFIMVIPVIWPCDNDLGVVKDYWDDQQSADMSGYAFARALSKFVCFSQTHNSDHLYHL